MSLVAETLGGSKATLWNYFPSKEALFTAVIEHEAKIFRDELLAELEFGSDLRVTLLRFCRRLIGLIVSPHALALRRMVTAEAVRFPEIGQFFFTEAPARFHAALADALDARMVEGALRKADPLEAAHVLSALCHTRCFRNALFQLEPIATQDDIEADASLAVDIFLRAYRQDRTIER